MEGETEGGRGGLLSGSGKGGRMGAAGLRRLLSQEEKEQERGTALPTRSLHVLRGKGGSRDIDFGD